jgi:hypothetical protein
MSGKAHQSQRVKRKQRKSEGRGAAADGAARDTPWPRSALPCWLVGLFAATAIASSLPQPAPAQTFDEASERSLFEINDNFGEFCGVPRRAGCWVRPGSDLDRLLTNNTPAGVLSAAPTTVAPQAAAGPSIERRLQAVRESDERRREAGAARAIYASYPRDAVLADNGQFQLPPAGGASPEIVVGPAQGLSLFVSAGAFALNHHNNRFRRWLRGAAAHGHGRRRLLDQPAAARRGCLQLYDLRWHL